MFKKGDDIIYPVYGAGKIIDIYQEEIDGEASQYYKIELAESKMSVSLPVDRATELGLRYPLSKAEFEKMLAKLEGEFEVDKEIFSNLDAFGKEKLNTGKVSDVIDLIHALKGKKAERDRLSFNENKRLETAMNFLKSEAELVFGEKVTIKLK